MNNDNIELNDLFDYIPLKIYQNKDCFKFSLDSILLSEYVKLTPRVSNILDLCTGNASVPLILSTKTKAHIDCIEIQKEICELALKSINYNNLDKQISLYSDNITNIDNYLKTKKYDIITCNPPYFKVNEGSSINKHEEKSIARHEITITLNEIFQIAAKYLNDGGEFYLVHRSERLDEIIINANNNKLNVKNIQLIKTKENSMPYIVLVRCVKKSKLGVKINDIKCIDKLKSYKELFKED